MTIIGEDSVCITQKYMVLKPQGKKSAQGSACYGDYFVQGYNNNGYISFYNLEEKKYLSTIEIPSPAPNSRIHANTLNFGSHKYKESDYFPLLYISSGYNVNGISYIYVYRIMRNGKRTDFSISLVQTISLINFGKWTEGIIDAENNYLWVKSAKGEKYTYTKYVLPEFSNNQVSIYYENSLDNIVIDVCQPKSSGQGHLFHGEKIYFVSGVPSRNQPLYLRTINTVTGEWDFSLNLADIGLVDSRDNKRNSFEPEGVLFYKGKLMICYRKALYILDIKKK